MTEAELVNALCTEFTHNPKCVGIDRVPIHGGYRYPSRYYGTKGGQYFYGITHIMDDRCISVNVTKEDAESKTFAEILQEE